MSDSREWIIPSNGEFRFEVDFGQTVVFKLSDGTAEVFGAELAPGKEYSVTGQKLAIFSFEGATVTIVKGQCSVEYVSSESVPVSAYLQLHLQLEKVRGAERTEGGPRVLVIGSGRNTLARTLANYAVRMGGKPIWVSLDIRNNPLFFPGTLSSHSLTAPIEVDEVSMAGGMAAEGTSPLSLFFGSTQVSDNQPLWNKLIKTMASAVKERLKKVPENGRSGCIIIGPEEQALTDGLEQAISGAQVENIQNAFGVDWVVVVGNERAHARLQKHFSRIPSMRILKLPKSGGIVNWPRPAEYDRQVMHRLFKAYFYGPRSELNPYTSVLPFSDFSLYRVLLGDEDIAPVSALPLGATRKLDECRAVKTEPSSALLLYSLIAIYNAPNPGTPDQEPQKIITDAYTESNVAGYLYVSGVDENKKTISVLSPCPGSPPSKIFLLGKLKWIE